MADDTSAADAEHDAGALHDAEEKMGLGGTEADEVEDPLDAGHDEGALHDAEEKMLLRNENTD